MISPFQLLYYYTIFSLYKFFNGPNVLEFNSPQFSLMDFLIFSIWEIKWLSSTKWKLWVCGGSHPFFFSFFILTFVILIPKFSWYFLRNFLTFFLFSSCKIWRTTCLVSLFLAIFLLILSYDFWFFFNSWLNFLYLCLWISFWWSLFRRKCD